MLQRVILFFSKMAACQNVVPRGTGMIVVELDSRSRGSTHEHDKAPPGSRLCRVAPRCNSHRVQRCEIDAPAAAVRGHVK